MLMVYLLSDIDLVSTCHPEFCYSPNHHTHSAMLPSPHILNGRSSSIRGSLSKALPRQGNVNLLPLTTSIFRLNNHILDISKPCTTGNPNGINAPGGWIGEGGNGLFFEVARVGLSLFECDEGFDIFSVHHESLNF
mmetsp:Transcript_8065/g.11862  ORF Transcript_8065/g.11862 Transcript_8065/m.11862 type:complete len:136 (-) Transcript_8065:135-542(-)